jgi:cytochrome c-type biogenesis protein CcmH
MADASPTAARRPSAATIILILAGLIAIASAAVAISRATGDDAKAESPAAADWRMVGWAYLEKGQAERSAGAYRRATEIEPGNAENWSSRGEALQVAATEVVPEAAAAFAKALQLDAADPRARYFLAVQKDIKGDHAGAVADWIAFLKDTPAGAPWEADLRRNIEQVAARHKIDIAGRVPVAGGTAPAAGAAIPGPTPEQLAAASSIPPGQQDAMVQGMVERLANRLKQNPRDAEGWIRLMRSRMVLGETDAAKAALRSGLAAFAGDGATQSRLRSAAAELGVPSGG